MASLFQVKRRTMFWLGALAVLLVVLCVAGPPLYREYEQRRSASDILKEIDKMPMPTPKDVADRIRERSK